MQPFERFLEIKYNEGSCRPTCSNEDWGTVNLEALSTPLLGVEYANNSRVHGNSPVIVLHLNSKGVKSLTVTFGKANGHGSTLPVNDMVECKLLSNFVLNVLSEKYPDLYGKMIANINPDCLLTEDDLDRATIQNVDDVKKMFVKDQDGLLSLQ
jgi:hypothetical protein